MPAKFLKLIRASADQPAEILVHGPIGKSFWSDEGISGKELTDALNEIPTGQKVVVGVNSQGGAVGEGLAIYNAINRRRNDVTVRIDGYALSIASFFPLAASRVVSPKSSIWMIHKAWNWASGNADQLRKDAEMLDTHDKVLADGYTSRTGKKRADIEAMMAAETWLTGEEAVAMKLADEESDVQVDLAPLDFAAAGLKADAAQLAMTKVFASRRMPAASAANPKPKQMNKTAIIALLKKHGVTAADDWTDEQLVAEMEKLVTSGKVSGKEKEDLAKLAKEPSADQKVVPYEEFIKVQQALAIQNRRWIEHQVDALLATRSYLEREDAIARCLGDEKYIEIIRKLPEDANSPVLGAGRRAVQVSEPEYKKAINGKKKGWERINFMVENYGELRHQEEMHARRTPQAANTVSGTINTSILNETVTTVLQDQCAPFAAFGRDFTADSSKPLATVVSKKVTAGGTVQTNATNFEDTTNFVATAAAVSVTMARYTGGGNLTPAEMNSGMLLRDWGVIKAAEFANRLWDVVSALFTTANFTNTPFVAAAGAFGKDDMNTIWGMIQKAALKNLVCDGTYFGKLLGLNTFDYNSGEGDIRRIGWPGWSTVGYSTRWSAAGLNVFGYAGANQGVRICADVPILPTSIQRAGLQSTMITLPGIGMAVQFNEWASTSTRLDWFTFDIAFGAAVDDGTAGILIKAA